VELNSSKDLIDVMPVDHAKYAELRTTTMNIEENQKRVDKDEKDS